MKCHLISQLDYADIKYYTGLKIGGLPEEMNNIARTGCGVCCFIMGVEYLTGTRISIEEGIKLAVESGATNNEGGTSLDVLCKKCAGDFGLTVDFSDDIKEMIDCLHKGDAIIANTGGDRDGYSCPFSPNGHYVYILGVKKNQLDLFDPANRPGKYDKWIEDGTVTMENNVISVDIDYFDRACNNKSPRYCILKKE